MLEYTWLALIGATVITAVTQKGRFWVSGIALGILVHVAVPLAFDLVAERRGVPRRPRLERGRQVGSALRYPN